MTAGPGEDKEQLPDGESPQPMTDALSVAEMPGDRECIKEARENLIARHIGGVALSERIKTKQKPIRNLHEAILWAKEGDEEAREMIKANVATDAMERIFKAGNIMDVGLDTDTQGRILQNGQLMDDVHRNAFQMASANSIIAERTKAEANNGARIEKLHKEGKLDDYAFVVLSRTPEGVDDEMLDKMNFFSKTKPIAIQLTTNDPEEGLHTESAFFAGVKDEDAPRHDKQVVEMLGDRFGVDYEDTPGGEVIDRPMLIHKSLLPNGVSSLVELADEYLGNTFFGEDMPTQEYAKFKEFCKQRQASFDTDVDEIVDELVKEHFTNAMQASKRLGKLTQDKMVNKAIEDHSIDADVFGQKGSEQITLARKAELAGDYQQARQYAVMALAVAKTGSCPTSLESILGPDGETESQKAEREKLSWHGGRKKKGKCVNCKTTTTVGVANWCKSCVKC